jgi:hypothetical protein
MFLFQAVVSSTSGLAAVQQGAPYPTHTSVPQLLCIAATWLATVLAINCMTAIVCLDNASSLMHGGCAYTKNIGNPKA